MLQTPGFASAYMSTVPWQMGSRTASGGSRMTYTRPVQPRTRRRCRCVEGDQGLQATLCLLGDTVVCTYCQAPRPMPSPRIGVPVP